MVPNELKSTFCWLSGQYFIKDVKPTAEGESSKIKVKARVNLHGIFSIVSASLVEKKESAEEETPMDVTSSENGNTAAPQTSGEAMDQTAPPQENGEVPTVGLTFCTFFFSFFFCFVAWFNFGC